MIQTKKNCPECQTYSLAERPWPGGHWKNRKTVSLALRSDRKSD
ncbi:Uncharacterized protein dnm_060970 [Desulfonema magnum]|uniref:Uncharacterized protein n=1 Tax=Desulfonema magnum TaxID=45655 RepID=A0A975BQV9_9BACT|nr:Uncharacterized protein dnm_060970 [Desulfonema magnum]